LTKQFALHLHDSISRFFLSARFIRHSARFTENSIRFFPYIVSYFVPASKQCQGSIRVRPGAGAGTGPGREHRVKVSFARILYSPPGERRDWRGEGPAGIPAATIMGFFSLNERAGPGKNRAGVPPGMAQIFRFCAKVAGPGMLPGC